MKIAGMNSPRYAVRMFLCYAAFGFIAIGQVKGQTTGFNTGTSGPWDYDDNANWVGGNINGVWDSSLVLTAPQTVTFDDDLVLSTGFNFGYSGNFALNLRGDGTDRSITLGGAILVSPSSNQTITIGSNSSGENLNVNLGGASRTVTVDSNKTVVFSNVVSNGSLVKEGGGTLTLSGANTFADGISLDGGTLNLLNPSALGSGTLTIGDGTVLRNNGPSNIVLSTNNAMNWNGSFEYNSSSTRALDLGNGNVTLEGPLTVTTWRNLTFSGTISGGSIFDITKAGNQRLYYTNAGVTSVSGNPTLNINSGSFFINHTFSGAGGITIAGGGDAHIGGSYSNASDYTGDLTITGSLNTFDNGGAALFAPNGARTGDVYLSGEWGFANNTVMNGLNGSGNLNYGHSGVGNVTIGDNNANGSFSGRLGLSSNFNTWALSKIGTGKQALLGSDSLYIGTTSVRGGVLEVSHLADGGSASGIGASSSAASNLVINGGTLRYIGAGSSTDRLFTLGGTTSGAMGSLESSGTGAVEFTNAGSLAYGTNNQTRVLTLGGTNTGNNTLAAAIDNNGTQAVSLIKAGSGKWILTGTNTYTGATTINGGTLLINGSIAVGSSVTVNGGTLGGSGAVVGLVLTSGTSSRISPGNSPGTLTLAGGLDATAGATFDFELGTSSDLISLGTGEFTGGSASDSLIFNFSDSGGFLAGTAYTLFTFGSSNGLDYSDLTASSFPSGFILDSGFGTDGFLITSSSLQVQFTVVPEPNSALLALGAIAVATFLRRNRRTA